MSKRLLLNARVVTKKYETTLNVKSPSIHNFFKTISKDAKMEVSSEESLIPGEFWVPQVLPDLASYGTFETSPGLQSPHGGYNVSWLRHVKLNEGISLPFSSVISSTEIQSYLKSLHNCLAVLWQNYLQDRELNQNFIVDPENVLAGVTTSDSRNPTADPL